MCRVLGFVCSADNGWFSCLRRWPKYFTIVRLVNRVIRTTCHVCSCLRVTYSTRGGRERCFNTVTALYDSYCILKHIQQDLMMGKLSLCLSLLYYTKTKGCWNSTGIASIISKTTNSVLFLHSNETQSALDLQLDKYMNTTTERELHTIHICTDNRYTVINRLMSSVWTHIHKHICRRIHIQGVWRALQWYSKCSCVGVLRKCLHLKKYKLSRSPLSTTVFRNTLHTVTFVIPL
jgi:hypothetical protein